jgi:transposase
LFSKLQQPSTLLFLQAYPTPQAAQAASKEQVSLLLKQAGHPTPEKVAATIVQTMRSAQLQADAVTIKTKSRLMLALVAQLVPLIEQLKAYDKEISELFLTHADSQIFASLPGAGKRLAPRLLAEWGTIEAAMPTPEASRRWLELALCPGKVGSTQRSINASLVSSPCATRCINLPGSRRGRNRGPTTITSANARKAKATVWPFAPWLMCGCA